MDSETVARLGYLAILLVAVGGWVVIEYRGRMGTAMRTLIAWGLIFGGVAAGYALWNDIRRDSFVIQSADGREITVPRAGDGHYYITLTIDGQPITFMADTGATNVVMSMEDAARVGIDVDNLMFLGQAETANGTVRIARTRVDTVTLGPFTDERLTVWVNEGDLGISLLGMDYLGRFRIQIDGNEMVLSR